MSGSISLLIKGRQITTRRYGSMWHCKQIIKGWIERCDLKNKSYELKIVPDEIKHFRDIEYHAKFINQKYHGKSREKNTDGSGTETDAKSIGRDF